MYVKKLFNDVSIDDLKRPIGKVHLLIGLDWCQLLPLKIAQEGNIQLVLCLQGNHPLLKTDEMS